MTRSAAELWTPDEQLTKATRDPAWLDHWYDIALAKAQRTRTVNERTAHIRLIVALIDEVRRLRENELIERVNAR